MKLSNYLKEEKKKEVVVLIGPPASGKSTYVAKYLKGYTVVSSDDIIEAYAKKKGITYTEAFAELDRKSTDSKFKANLIKAVKNETKVVIDRTNMTVKSRGRVLKHFDESWTKTAIVFSVDRKELDKRLANRAKETGKDIPKKVVDGMIKSFEQPSKKEFDVIKNV